jgi:sugar/nucleoside kinase (ribokinase family)
VAGDAFAAALAHGVAGGQQALEAAVGGDEGLKGVLVGFEAVEEGMPSRAMPSR